jgi:Zn-dependent peptidase ImmA (M78 family)/transcriptional regulator with XRE-family HTH domain
MTADTGRKAPETPFGVRLRAARKMAGLSMEDLAGKLGGLVTKQAISKYEQGRMMPSPEVLERLVSVLREATWGASPLRAEDAQVELRLPLACPVREIQCAEPSRMAFRRQGLLRRIIRSGTGEPVKAKAVDSKDDICCFITAPDVRIPLSGPAREIPGKTGEDAAFQRGIPSATELNALASITDRRARYLEAWRSDPEVNRIQFRAGEKLSAKTEAALKHRIADHLQKYLELESVLGASAAFENPLAGHSAGTGEEVEGAATEVRRRWELGHGPVVNLLGLLEDKGIKVYETRGLEGFEGLSGRFGHCPFVAVNVDRPPDRVRFTAAHELGHVMCDLSATESPESGCHAFGAAFLLPRAVLEKRFTTSRRKVTMGELGEIKETYGISLQAIMYRAHGLGLITDRQLRAFRETIKAKGWVVEEPVAYAGLERAGRFRRLLHYAVAADILDVGRAAEMAGVPAEELEKEIGEIF